MTGTLLFDLLRDPGEKYNVIDMYPDKVKELEKYTRTVREDLGDSLTQTPGTGRRAPGKI